MEIILLPPQWYTQPQSHHFYFGNYWRILARDSPSNGTVLKWMTNIFMVTSFIHDMANENTYLFSPLLFPYFSPKTWRDDLVLQSSQIYYTELVTQSGWEPERYPTWKGRTQSLLQNCLLSETLKNGPFYFLYIIPLSATKMLYIYSLTSPDKYILYWVLRLWVNRWIILGFDIIRFSIILPNKTWSIFLPW